jgi:hypothetical protein
MINSDMLSRRRKRSPAHHLTNVHEVAKALGVQVAGPFEDTHRQNDHPDQRAPPQCLALLSRRDLKYDNRSTSVQQLIDFNNRRRKAISPSHNRTISTGLFSRIDPWMLILR